MKKRTPNIRKHIRAKQKGTPGRRSKEEEEEEETHTHTHKHNNTKKLPKERRAQINDTTDITRQPYI